jgi:hypothetical protein
MCDATAVLIGSQVVGAVSDIAGTAGERKQAKANQSAARDALSISLEDIQARGAEETLAAAQEVRSTQRQARAAAATARVSAGEAGVGGISVDLLTQDVERQAGERNESIRQNRDLTLRQLDREARGARAEALARVRGNEPPSFLNAGIRIASRGLGAYGEHLSRSP